MEDPQRLAWNLVKWVRQRLYLLGLIDLGYDRARRPVAMRLTHGGARLLGLDRIGPVIPSRVGSLVVTPDFEVVLFPTGDDVELIHDLDRFCVREKLGSVMHFRITQEAVRRGLKGGMVLRDVLRTLEAHSRTPIPQNVRFSIRDWAVRAGLMTLSDELVLRCEDPETLRRFQQDPGRVESGRRALPSTRCHPAHHNPSPAPKPKGRIPYFFSSLLERLPPKENPGSAGRALRAPRAQQPDSHAPGPDAPSPPRAPPPVLPAGPVSSWPSGTPARPPDR
jgi:hypothetical protein